jgi:hypothetical protein
MATAFSTAYEQLPQKPSVWTPKTVHPRIAGMMFPIFWQYTMPVGQTTADIIKVCDLLANVPVASPQIAGLRFGRVTLRSAGNVGGSVAVNFGTPASPTLFGAALTTLQSATILDVTVATLAAAGPILQNTNLQLVLTAGPSTTQQIIDGWVWLFDMAP